MEGFFDLFLPLMGVVLVIVLAYFGTKWVAKKYTGSALTGKYMKVLDRIVLGQDRSLALVRIGGKIYLLGISPKGVDTVDVLEEADLPQEQAAPKTDFSGLWGQAAQRWAVLRRQSNDETGVQHNPKEQDFFHVLAGFQKRNQSGQDEEKR